MKKDEIIKVVAEEVVKTENESTGTTRRIFARMRRAARRRARKAMQGMRNYAFEARCIPI